ncbi:unnamed protein product [Arctogadus glacialis]
MGRVQCPKMCGTMSLVSSCNIECMGYILEEEGRGRKRRGAEMSQFERGLLAVMGPLAALASQPQRIPPALPDEEEAALFRVRSFTMRRLSVARLRCEVHQLVLEAEMEELGRE